MFVLDFAPHLPRKTYPARNVRISPDAGTLAATFGKEGRAEHAAWWNLTDGKLIGTSAIRSPNLSDGDDSNLMEPVFTPDLARCAIHGVAYGSGSMIFEDVVLVAPDVSYEQGVSFDPNDEYEELSFSSLAITSNGQFLLAGHGGLFSRWNLKKVNFDLASNPRPLVNKTEATFDPGKRYEGDGISLRDEDEDDGPDETALAFSPDGKLLALGLRCDSVQVYTWRSRKLKAMLEDASEPDFDTEVRGLVFSPDGTHLAARVGGRVIVYDITAETPLTDLAAKKLSDMAFTPDGRRLLTGGADKLVRVWDTVTWKEVARFDWKIGAIHSVTVSADGAIAAAGGDKCRVVVWDLEE